MRIRLRKDDPGGSRDCLIEPDGDGLVERTGKTDELDRNVRVKSRTHPAALMKPSKEDYIASLVRTRIAEGYRMVEPESPGARVQLDVSGIVPEVFAVLESLGGRPLEGTTPARVELDGITLVVDADSGLLFPAEPLPLTQASIRALAAIRIISHKSARKTHLSVDGQLAEPSGLWNVVTKDHKVPADIRKRLQAEGLADAEDAPAVAQAASGRFAFRMSI